MVSKDEPGDLHPWDEYRALNSVTDPASYSALHGKTIFSTVDLDRAYHQIPVAADDVPKTAIESNSGPFALTLMPLMLFNTTQTFQLSIDSVQWGLDYALVYKGKRLVASVFGISEWF